MGGSCNANEIRDASLPVNKFFLYQALEFTGKPLTEGGLRLGYIWANGKYEAAAFGRNVTDTGRITGAIDFNNLAGFTNEPQITLC